MSEEARDEHGVHARPRRGARAARRRGSASDSNGPTAPSSPRRARTTTAASATSGRPGRGAHRLTSPPASGSRRRARHVLPRGGRDVHARRPGATTTCRCCCRRSPTRPTGGAEHASRRNRPGRQPLRQGRDPRGAGRARHGPARDPRPRRVQRAARRLRRRRTSPATSRAVLPTDTQKNTVLAFAKEVGVASLEEFATALARHFVDDVGPVSSASRDGRRVRLGPGDGRRPPARPHLRPPAAPRSAPSPSPPRPARRTSCRAARPGAAQVDRLGVPRLPHATGTRRCADDHDR